MTEGVLVFPSTVPLQGTPVSFSSKLRHKTPHGCHLPCISMHDREAGGIAPSRALLCVSLFFSRQGNSTAPAVRTSSSPRGVRRTPSRSATLKGKRQGNERGQGAHGRASPLRLVARARGQLSLCRVGAQGEDREGARAARGRAIARHSTRGRAAPPYARRGAARGLRPARCGATRTTRDGGSGGATVATISASRIGERLPCS